MLSDIHFAGAAEQQRHGFDSRVIRNPALLLAAQAWRHWVWLRDPLGHNHRLDQLLRANPDPDLVVANGDFTVDTAFVGVSDDGALASASEALDRLRAAYGPRLLATIGDHELGKTSLFGGAGGLRLESWRRCREVLQLEPVWRRDVGPWTLMGIASTPV
ncbi:MAG: metallophosphoesterase, partial [Verrucomicrobiae bacterium]|nr:metallophosphoesterase [Verrucomicrobiae bacterium]